MTDTIYVLEKPRSAGATVAVQRSNGSTTSGTYNGPGGGFTVDGKTYWP